ncbi:hypothetical protein C8F01DRAFT_1083524 [Mycena amicta]|nr:hypothetical protein C8F01DRAFT_1083524 [Mycena amicta]
MAPARHLQDVEQSRTSDIPIRIPDGSMTIQELYTWIRHADVDIQNSLITDICWWAESENSVEAPDPDSSVPTRWRAGKAMMDPFRRAMDKATFKPGTRARNPSFYKSHRLLFALLTDKNIAPEGSFCFDGFVDFLDYKWAGPYPRLRDLGRYVEVISTEEPRYSLTSSNCYWFSRLVFHTLALRHYAFPFVVSSIRPRNYVLPRTAENTTYGTSQIEDEDWQHHDPSSVGLVFRFLHYEEWRNGILMFRRIIITSMALLSCAATAGGGYGLYHLWRNSPTLNPKAAAAFSALTAIFFTLPLCVLFSGILVRWNVALLTYCLIRRKTLRVLKLFDRGSDLQSIRGDCVPPKLPISRGPVHDGSRAIPRPRNAGRAQAMFIYHTPRQLPNAWQHEKQIYVGKKDEYLRALADMWRAELKRRARPQGMSSANPIPHMAEVEAV